MPNFFVNPEQIDIEQKRVSITGSDVNHVRNVLRMKEGGELHASNGVDGKKYCLKILSFSKEEVCCEICDIWEGSAELPSQITLFQGLPKADKMELIIQKSVELGVSEVVPVACKRCVVKLDAKKEKSKRTRWQAIAEAAAKQSRRSIIPEIGESLSFSEAVARAKELDVCLFPYENAEGMEETKKLISSIKGGERIGVFIGPEGGFEEAEVNLAKMSGCKVITLGKRILRTETAGLTVLSWLMYHLEG